MIDTLSSDAKFWGGITRITEYFQQINQENETHERRHWKLTNNNVVSARTHIRDGDLYSTSVKGEPIRERMRCERGER